MGVGEREVKASERIPAFADPAAIVNSVEKLDSFQGDERVEAFQSFKEWVDEGVADLISKWDDVKELTNNVDCYDTTYARFDLGLDEKLRVGMQHIDPHVSHHKKENLEITIDVSGEKPNLVNMSITAVEPNVIRSLRYRIVSGYASFEMTKKDRTAFSIQLENPQA